MVYYNDYIKVIAVSAFIFSGVIKWLIESLTFETQSNFQWLNEYHGNYVQLYLYNIN